MVKTVTFDELLEQWKQEKAARVEAQERVATLTAEVAWLKKHLFGQKSEKNIVLPPPDSPQLDLFGAQQEATRQEIAEEVSKPRSEPKRAPRRPVPQDLPREEIVHDVADEEKLCACCGKQLGIIGEDVTEKIEIVPARVFVRRHVRPRYACGACKERVAQAPLPSFPIPRASAGASLLAFLLISKYADHLPLCRMERIFARHGIDLPRRKTSEWMMEIAELLAPLVRLMHRHILERCNVVGADETPIAMLDPGGGKNKTKTCYLWQYRGDDSAPYTVFDFRESRGREGPRKMLGDYAGYLQCDAYSVYSSLGRESAFTQVGCWAHARRKFIEALEGGDKRAQEAVAIIAELYAVEKHARERVKREENFDAEALRAMRQEHSVPVLAKLRAWMDAQLAVAPKSPLGNAIGYALDNWVALNVYITDGRVPIDNNAVERAIRPVALGRKNWLFAGSNRGGQAAATFFTLIDSARRADLNLWDYTTDLLTHLPAHPINQLDELLPDNWKPSTR
jgi:transposase